MLVFCLSMNSNKYINQLSINKNPIAGEPNADCLCSSSKTSCDCLWNNLHYVFLYLYLQKYNKVVSCLQFEIHKYCLSSFTADLHVHIMKLIMQAQAHFCWELILYVVHIVHKWNRYGWNIWVYDLFLILPFLFIHIIMDKAKYKILSKHSKDMAWIPSSSVRIVFVNCSV